jgi:hypothetical protein
LGARWKGLVENGLCTENRRSGTGFKFDLWVRFELRGKGTDSTKFATKASTRFATRLTADTVLRLGIGGAVIRPR